MLRIGATTFSHALETIRIPVKRKNFIRFTEGQMFFRSGAARRVLMRSSLAFLRPFLDRPTCDPTIMLFNKLPGTPGWIAHKHTDGQGWKRALSDHQASEALHVSLYAIVASAGIKLPVMMNFDELGIYEPTNTRYQPNRHYGFFAGRYYASLDRTPHWFAPHLLANRSMTVDISPREMEALINLAQEKERGVLYYMFRGSAGKQLWEALPHALKATFVQNAIHKHLAEVFIGLEGECFARFVNLVHQNGRGVDLWDSLETIGLDERRVHVSRERYAYFGCLNGNTTGEADWLHLTGFRGPRLRALATLGPNIVDLLESRLSESSLQGEQAAAIMARVRAAAA